MPPAAVVVISWLVPGAGHLVQGRRQKGLIFLIALVVMFAIGLALNGALNPFVFSDPLVGLAAFAQLGMGIPYFIASMLGLGKGVVTAQSYEYGNTFLLIAGLLNYLTMLDAFDIAAGRKP